MSLDEIFNNITEEEYQAYENMVNAIDDFYSLVISNRFHAKIERIENDPDHISVDGVPMDREQFNSWLVERMPELLEVMPAYQA